MVEEGTCEREGECDSDGEDGLYAAPTRETTDELENKLHEAYEESKKPLVQKLLVKARALDRRSAKAAMSGKSWGRWRLGRSWRR